MVRWTDEAIERLYAGAKAGETAAMIAAALGLRPRDVETKAERLRIKWAVPEPAGGAREAASASLSEASGRARATGRWCDAAIDRLRDLAATGLSAGEVSHVLSREFDDSFSRNAVIGKASRLGIVFGGGTASKARAIALKPKAARMTKAARSASEWDEARERRLRDLARSGHSAREIAEVLGATKNAIVGKAARMMVRLTGRARPVSRRPVVDPGAPNPSLSVLFLERARGQCTVILDDTAPILERRCCGAPVSGERYAFCAHHRLRYTIESGRAAA